MHPQRQTVWAASALVSTLNKVEVTQKHTNTHLASVSVALMLGSFAGAANAIPVAGGTGIFVAQTRCTPEAAPSVICNPTFPSLQRVFAAEPGSPASMATTTPITPVNFGTAEASATLTGTVGAPILRAKAISEPNGRTAADAVAVQRFVYTGTETTTRTFGGALSYFQSVPFAHDPAFPDRSTLVNATINIYASPSSTINVGVGPAAIYNDLLHLLVNANPDLVLIGQSTWRDYLSTTTGNAALAVTITLNPGDSVWLQAYLQVRAAGGGFADASNTLITSWDNPADLVPGLVGSIPEPGTLALMGLGLAAGLWRVKRLELKASAAHPATVG